MPNKIQRTLIHCACGCGELIPDRNERGRLQRYAARHFRRNPETRPRTSWNKGRVYVIKKIKVYKTKTSYAAACRRVFGDACMNCEWDRATCDVHHIVPKSEGGQNILDNGVVLCPNCHRLVHVGVLTTDDLNAMKSRVEPRCDFK